MSSQIRIQLVSDDNAAVPQAHAHLTRRGFLRLLAGGGAAAALAACGAAAPSAPASSGSTSPSGNTSTSGAKELAVGAIMPLSGPLSPVGLTWGRGYQLYYNQLNANGGLKIGSDTYTIKFVLEDGASNPEKGATAATKLVSQDGAKLVFGEISDAVGSAIDKVTTPAGALHVITLTTPFNAVDVSKDKPLTARLMISPYDNQALLSKALVAKYPDAKKVAIVVPDLGYEKMIEDLTALLKKQAIEVIYVKKFPFGTQDFVPIYTDVLSKQPDAIWMVRSGQSPAQVKTGTDLEFGGVFVDDTPRDPDFHIRTTGDALHNLLVSGMDISQMNKEMKVVADAWAASHKEPFASDALMAWDQAWVVTQAMQKAQSVEPAKVMATLESMTAPGSVQTVFGSGQMAGAQWYGVARGLLRPVPITQIVDGKKTFLGLELPPAY
jgi:branched-chain amino acid transport system substrate-binding protein